MTLSHTNSITTLDVTYGTTVTKHNIDISTLCPTTYTYHNFNGYETCLRLYGTLVTFYEARRQCLQDGGDLAIPYNTEMNAHLATSGSQFAWIGYFDPNYDNAGFLPVQNYARHFTYNNWVGAEPNTISETAAVISSQTTWFDTNPQTNDFPFFCEINKFTKKPVSVKSTLYLELRNINSVSLTPDVVEIYADDNVFWGNRATIQQSGGQFEFQNGPFNIVDDRIYTIHIKCDSLAPGSLNYFRTNAVPISLILNPATPSDPVHSGMIHGEATFIGVGGVTQFNSLEIAQMTNGANCYISITTTLLTITPRPLQS